MHTLMQHPVRKTERTRMARAAALAAIVASFAVTGACKQDACEGRPTEIEIAIQPDETVRASQPSFVRVTLTLNDKVVVSREFDTPAPTFVFEPRENDEAPRSITVSATAYTGADRALGSGQTDGSFGPDGCNFIAVPVRSHTGNWDASDAANIDDAGIDGDAPHDGPPADACSYPCGEQCCINGELCFESVCSKPGDRGTAVFATQERHRADMAGRTGTATICESDKPDELSCSALQAMLTVSAADELRGMPTTYGFGAEAKLYFFHQTDRYLTLFANNWADALDSLTPNIVSARTGTGVRAWSNSDGFWTGSKRDGSFDAGEYDYTCQGWTCRDGSEAGCQQTLGSQGDPTVLDTWLHSQWNYIACSRSLYILCACRLE